MNMSSYKCCTPNTQGFAYANSLAQLLQLVGETNRLQILCLLRKSSHCVCEIMDHFPMSQSLISHHLADLREAGIVTSVKAGRKVQYSLTKRGKEISDILFTL